MLQRLMLLGSLGTLFMLGVTGSGVEHGVLRTSFLLLCVQWGGFWLIVRYTRDLATGTTTRIAFIYTAKLLIVLVLAVTAWEAQLDPSRPGFGGDPQRFYYQAWDLARAGFPLDLAAALNINYTGVLFYLGAVFLLFGHNVVAPALINAFLTLGASLLLVRVASRIDRADPSIWVVGLAMILPEVLWFDTVTGRDSLAMALFTLTAIKLGEYVFLQLPTRKNDDRGRLWLILSGAVLLGLVRVPMVVPLALLAGAGFMYGPRSTRTKLTSVVLAVSLAGGLVGVGYLSQMIGGYELDLAFLLRRGIAPPGGVERAVWSKNSVGQMLVPGNALELVLFLPLRFVAYLLAPLPQWTVDLSALMASPPSGWRELLLMASSIINGVLFPLLVASLIQTVRTRDRRSIILHAPYWLTMAVVAGGTLVLQVRYRIMTTLFLWGCAWLGRKADKRLILQCYTLWFLVLTAGVSVYYAVKL